MLKRMKLHLLWMCGIDPLDEMQTEAIPKVDVRILRHKQTLIRGELYDVVRCDTDIAAAMKLADHMTAVGIERRSGMSILGSYRSFLARTFVQANNLAQGDAKYLGLRVSSYDGYRKFFVYPMTGRTFPPENEPGGTDREAKAKASGLA